MIEIKVVVSGIKDSGNLGALARLCDNFGVDELILVSPQCEIDDIAYQRATRSRRYLDSARIVSSIEESLEHVDYLLAFTGKPGAKRKIAMKPVPLSKVSHYIGDYAQGTIGLLFGNESTGLTMEEISKCDLSCIIPTYGENPILNITHSAAVGLYVIRQIFEEEVQDWTGLRFLSSEEKRTFFEFIDRMIDASSIQDHNKKSTKVIFKNVFKRASASPKEIKGLIAMARQLAESLEKSVISD